MGPLILITGMAVVYRARDERLGRLVALKVLAPGLAADEEFRRRFIAESRSAAAVDDPHIIPVYEAGEAGGVLFIAMRFVPGRDLRAVLAGEGPLDPKRVADFISPVASALDAAHRAGLVHRDVKPANILVDERPGRAPHVYLSDFGVSKGAMSSAGMTASGVFLGTPDYAAPEHGGAVRAHVRAAAAVRAAAGPGRSRGSGTGPGAGQGPGEAVRILPRVRRRAAGRARGGGGPGPRHRRGVRGRGGCTRSV